MDEMISDYQDRLQRWLASCTRGGRISRNTIAVGMVVMDHLRRTAPVHRDQIISSGGEIKGARSGLGRILQSYGIPDGFLKEVTTRQAHQDGQRLLELLDWGIGFRELHEEVRTKLLDSLITLLVNLASEWLNRQHIRIALDRRHSPATWIGQILKAAEGRSGGVVEQHLVGAKLSYRFPSITVSNYPAHAADVQTERDGDFVIAQLVYHVTAAPSLNVLQKCAVNLRAAKHPVLVVPSAKENKARALADELGILDDITILSIESFLSVNVIELSLEKGQGFLPVLEQIIHLYNHRLEQVETDLSAKIELE